MKGDAIERFPRLRQSFLATFADCRLAAAFELRLTLAAPDGTGLHTQGYDSHRSTAGTVAHATIAEAFRLMLGRREERVSPAMMMDLLDVELARAPSAVTPQEARFLRRTLRKWARDHEWSIDDIYGVELRLEATVPYPDGTQRVLTGQLDLLMLDESGEHATVEDHKHTWRLPATRTAEGEHDAPPEEDEEDSLSAEGYFQQRFYGLLVFVHLPRVQSVTLRERYLPRSVFREATIWRHEMPDLMAEFSAYAQAFDECYDAQAPRGPERSALLAAQGLLHALDERGPYREQREALRAALSEREAPLHKAWRPSPGTHCDHCPLAVECPVEVDARGPGRILSLEHAEQVAGEHRKALAVAKQTGDALKVYCDRHGPIRIRDAKRTRYLGFVPTTTVKRPSRDEVAQAQERGVDPRTLFRRIPGTRFTEFSPKPGDDLGEDPDDVVEQFERAAEAARRRRARA